MVTQEYRESGHITRLGWLVVIMALISMLVVLYGTYQDRQQTQCQARVNAAFFSITKARAQIADDDRQAIRDLVQGISEATTQEEYAELFDEYDAANVRLDAARAKLVYPDAEDICTQ